MVKNSLKKCRIGTKKKLLVVFLNDSTFVREDIRILSKHFDVTPFHFKFKIAKLYSLLQFIRRNDVIYIWFASYHALFATIITRFIHRPIIVVTGGYDVACVPEINYGLLLRKTTRFMVKYVLKRATKIISVSHFNKKELQKNLQIDTSIVVPNTQNVKFFLPSGQKENLVSTVCYINWKNVRIKGLELFTSVAKEFPEIQFAIIGGGPDDVIDYLKALAPKNIIIPGHVTNEEILRYYQKTKVYCQLSSYESFGLAVVESMLCECVPVVTDRGALPEVVGDTGFYTKYDNISQTKNAIEKALQSQDKGKQARKRILENFSQQHREMKLKELIDTI